MRHINLLPWRELRRRDQQRRFSQQTLTLLLVLVLALVIIYLQTSGSLSEQRQRNGFLQQQINVLQEQINHYQGVSGNGSSSKEGLKVLAGLKGEREALVKVLDELPRRVPEGINLTELRQQERVLHISGNADTSSRVSEFLRRLEQGEVFSSVRLSVIKVVTSQGSPQGHSFVLEADMPGSGGR